MRLTDTQLRSVRRQNEILKEIRELQYELQIRDTPGLLAQYGPGKD